MFYAVRVTVQELMDLLKKTKEKKIIVVIIGK
jgi:hypothetical protein